MSIAADHVPFFRSHWTFTDTVTITRLSTRGTLNLSTLDYSETTTPIYTGGALLRPAGAAAVTIFGDQATVEGKMLLLLPHTAAGLRPDDRVTVNTSLYEADLVGAKLTITDVTADSYLTKRAALCRRDQGQGET